MVPCVVRREGWSEGYPSIIKARKQSEKCTYDEDGRTFSTASHVSRLLAPPRLAAITRMTNARRREREIVQIVSVSPRRMWRASAKIIFYVKRTILKGSWDPGQSVEESSRNIMAANGVL